MKILLYTFLTVVVVNIISALNTGDGGTAAQRIIGFGGACLVFAIGLLIWRGMKKAVGAARPVKADTKN